MTTLRINRFLILSYFVFLISPLVSAASWYETTGHPGSICVPCHQRFSERSVYAADIPVPLKNPEIQSLFPCVKPGCHKYNRNFPEDVRWQRHLGICGNCHSQKNGKYNIHENHLNFSLLQPPWELSYPSNISLREKGVECEICHASPSGYNSTIASVPPLNITSPAPPVTIIKPPWNNSCSYCHPTARNAKRLHEVHEPVVLQACPVCHTSKVFEQTDFVLRVAGEKSLLEKKLIEVKEEFFAVKELRSYFYSIADQIIKAYVSYIGGEKKA